MKGIIGRTALVMAALLLPLLATSCDNEQGVHAGNLVTVAGYVYQSAEVRVGVADVTVVIEKSDESSSATIVPDILVHTDENGRYEARFTLGYSTGGGDASSGGSSGDGGGQSSGGDPFTPVPQIIEESMRILMVSPENKFFDLGSGFTFQVGKHYDIWPVFLNDFGQQTDQ
jgi:hypothetical protein